MSNTKTEAQRLADQLTKWANDYATTDDTDSMARQAAAELRRLDAESKELREALTLAHENYEFQRNKANGATSTVYAFHYAMKDAGWHPGRTDDDLTEIIRQKGKALAEAEAERDQLRAQLAKAVAEEREACALECESRQANGNRTHTHPDECAAAIRARSNT